MIPCPSMRREQAVEQIDDRPSGPHRSVEGREVDLEARPLEVLDVTEGAAALGAPAEGHLPAGRGPVAAECEEGRLADTPGHEEKVAGCGDVAVAVAEGAPERHPIAAAKGLKSGGESAVDDIHEVGEAPFGAFSWGDVIVN